MTQKTRLILLSSTAGLGIEACAQRLCDSLAPARPFGPIRVEKFHAAEAAACLTKRRQPPARGFTFVNVLELLLPELASVCHRSWRSMLESVRSRPDSSSPFAVATFHPVLFHQGTSEFAEPYLAGQIRELTNSYGHDHNIHVEWIVSIHDDVYDVYKRLMKPNALFAPGERRKARNPIEDIADLRMLLEWRDRELSSARAMAESLGARHLLFHRKGRLDSLRQIVFEGKACVYYSHPISQPRRDITNVKVDTKCSEPTPKRGQETIASIQAFADQLAINAAIVEPTAIDEYRFNTDRLENLTDKDISSSILPPLTRRWPIGGGERFGGDSAELNSENELELLPLRDEALKAMQALKTTGIPLVELKSSVELLRREVKRQINVRDHVLAAQAELLVAFRPYSLPDSPNATGGVSEEIATARLKEKLGLRRCKPSLIIVHPRKDELQRRGNEFDKIWDTEVGQHYEMPNDSLEQLKAACRSEIASSGSIGDAAALDKFLRDAFELHKVSARPKTGESSMSKETLALAEDAQHLFIASLTEAASIFKPPLEVEAEKSEGTVLFVNVKESEYSSRLSALVTQAVNSLDVPKD